MILYLAAGGGLGHLTRMRAVVHTLGIDEPITLLAPPRHGSDRRIIGDAIHLPLTDDLARDLSRYRSWLRGTIDRVAPSRMIVDVFPGGILGELCGLELPAELPLDLVARAVRWDRYSALLGEAAPRYESVYITEPLPLDQLDYLRRQSDRLVDLELADPPSTLDVDSILESCGVRNGEFWLVVHSGPDAEIVALIAHAELIAAQESISPPILLIAPRRPAMLDAGIHQLDLYPATPLFPHAARIITACGFNAMRQTEPWRDRHLSLPFDRRYDDQRRRKEQHLPYRRCT